MRHARCALVVVIVAGCAEPALPPATTARDYYVAGMKEYRVRQYGAALADFENSYLLKPDPALLFDLGQVNRQLGKYDEALQNYRAYLKQLPRSDNRAAVEELIEETRRLAGKRKGL